jgi:hypothetical protein
MVSCARSPSTVLTTFANVGRERFHEVDAVGMLGREHHGVQPDRMVPSYCTVTWVLPSGRR